MNQDRPTPPSDPLLQRLDQIELHLRNLDGRDRWRMIGSTIRGLINVGFLVFAIWSSWYLLTHMTDIMKTISEQTAQATMQAGKNGSEDLLKRMQEMFKK